MRNPIKFCIFINHCCLLYDNLHISIDKVDIQRTAKEWFIWKCCEGVSNSLEYSETVINFNGCGADGKSYHFSDPCTKINGYFFKQQPKALTKDEVARLVKEFACYIKDACHLEYLPKYKIF